MVVTLKWLKDFVNLEGISAKQIADAFTFSGFEIESYKDQSEKLKNVVVGKIEKIVKHPNADKLLICSISDGEKIHQIITHATNMKEGDFVPMALEGADLANGVKIKPTNMRGVESCGMMCAGEELGIDNSVYEGAETDGIMILKPEDCKVGQPIAEVLGLDDVVFDVNVLANRPDCQSVMGLAKELACAFNREFKYPKLDFNAIGDDLPLKLQSKTENCKCFLAGIVRDVKLTESPKWIQARLRSVGLVPHNIIVDITNYVLCEIGQPLHAYDYSSISGNTIIVRQAENGEKITLLNGNEYELTENDVVIANSSNAMGLAGVMGGKDFSINENTRDIVIESASFKKETIRKTSRGIGLRTDASGRYERGVEPVGCELGLKRALTLFEQVGCGKVAKTVHKTSEVENIVKWLQFDYDRIQKWLGIEIPYENSVKILNKLGIKTSYENRVLKCGIPAERTDIENFSDIAEEIIRYYGFDKLTSSHNLNTSSISGGYQKAVKLSCELKKLMLATGASEIKTFTFIGPESVKNIEMPQDCYEFLKQVRIRNPLNSSMSVMRTQMLSSVLSAVKYNINHKNTNFSLFEIGKVFFANEEFPIEKEVLSYITTNQKDDFFTVKAIVELVAQNIGLVFSYKQANNYGFHPNICADIMWANKKIGTIGKVHPKVLGKYEISKDCYYFEICLEGLPDKKVKKVKPPAKFPSSTRDFAFVLNVDIPVGEIIEVIKKSAGTLCEDVELFDIYQGEQVGKDEKSIAVKLVFRKTDGTLTQEEVNLQVEKILADMKTKYKAKLRE